ncbi:MAG TPA: hypothetical protein VE863_17670 [Pyrinomonadaceae bacterium]|nr:hypothetical protein [Pyrinomonadaceae bacterium]
MNLTEDFALLLTASVDPNGMPGLTQTNPLEREGSYAKCFEYYLRSDPLVQRIVLAENSGWPLDRFVDVSSRANLHNKSVEFLSFACNDFPRERGKSFGELLLIEKAMGQSRLIAESTYVGKLTGRNLLMNVTALLQSISREFDFCCDIRDHNFYQMLGLPDCGHHCDSRFFIFTRSYYEQYLQGRHVECSIGNGYLIEGLLFDLVKATESSERVIKRFRVEPDFRGMAGHFIRNKAKNYGSPRELWKRRIRACSRRVAPWLYI